MATMPDHLPIPSQEDVRYCQARLRLLIDTMPETAYFNPTGMAVICAAFYVGRADLGDLPLWRMATAVGLQLVAAAAAFLIWRRFRTVPRESTSTVRRWLIAVQILIGLSWSGGAWLLWLNGNPANNGFVVIIMAMALWAMTLTRCAVRTVFFAGLTALALPLVVRFAISSGAAATVFVGLFPVWMCYMVFTGTAARKRVDDMLAARFAHEDLSKELTAARDEAVQKRKEAEAANHSKTSFLANMSHELRTPLNAIIGFSEIIASQALGLNNERYPEYAGDIHSSGTHLLNLINEILDVAKIEAGRMEILPRPLDIASALEAVERIMAIRAGEKSLEMTYTVDSDLGEIVADERAVRQILLNLLSNAIKFTPNGGQISVVCRAVDEGMVLSVADTGPGIPADKLAMLFKPFVQIDNRFDHHHSGTGLGLVLVQGLARLHGGRAWIESEEGRGATSFVYLPLVAVKRELKRVMQ